MELDGVRGLTGLHRRGERTPYSAAPMMHDGSDGTRWYECTK
jgi:hypothetical protein